MAMRSAFHHHLSFGQVFKNLSEPLAAIERGGHLIGIYARQLKENMGSDGHDRGAHLCWILFEKLIGGNDRDSELAGF